MDRGALVVLASGLSSCVLASDYSCLFYFFFAARSWKKRLGFVLLLDTTGLVGFCIMVLGGFMTFLFSSSF